MSVQSVVSVDEVIDRSPINRFRMMIFLFCVLVMMLDGFDTQAVAFVAPSLMAEWKLLPGTLGLIFSSALFGAIIGAFGLGIISDKIGRRRALVLSILWFGVFNLACAFATSAESFLALRFLCGLGLGGAIPNLIALVTEYAPQRRRALLISITWAGFALGAVLGGLASIPLLSHFNWQAIFVVGGVLPLLVAPIIAMAIPESIKFLNLSSGRSAEIVSILKKVDPSGQYDSTTVFSTVQSDVRKSSVLALFQQGRAVGSIFLCFALFMSLLLVYLFLNWIPLLLKASGLSLSNALLGTVIFNLGGIIGSVVCAMIVDKNGKYAVVTLLLVYLLAGLSVASIGLVPNEFGPIMATIFLSGFLVIGVQLPLQAVIASYYPTSIRATGIGWSQVVGRGGSLVGPLLGGALVAKQFSPAQLFQVSSVAPFLAALSLAIYLVLSRGRSGIAESAETEAQRAS